MYCKSLSNYFYDGNVIFHFIDSFDRFHQECARDLALQVFDTAEHLSNFVEKMCLQTIEVCKCEIVLFFILFHLKPNSKFSFSQSNCGVLMWQ